ncbi:hypothetical protein R1flu_009377 [Riccia fluitans]|uniref:RING-type domain-containing protein n=1 Tax=Riccia fluitans TaxID=41844 RepID=A0ABD1Z1X3_9MARC
MEDYPELKHALEQNKGLTKYKTDCSVCGDALGFLSHVEAGICEHKFHFNCFWEYASRSRRCPICRVLYPRKMYDFFCTIFVPEGAEVINRDTGEVDTGEAGLHPEEFQGGDNEVDIVARDETRFLGRVPRAIPSDEHTPSGECGSDYIDELGPLTVARLRHEFALLESQVRGHRPLTRAQARILSHQAEQAEHSPPEEVTPAEIPMDHVEDIQSPPLDVASEPTEATQESSAHNSEGLEVVPYTPRKVQTTVVAVEVPSSLESPRDGTHTRQEFDDWKSYDDLTKEDIDSILKPRGYVRGDVINMYIKAKFLGLPRGALYGKFFVNTFWFSRVKTLTDKFQNDFNNKQNSPIVAQALSIFIAIALNRSPEDIYVGEYYNPQQTGNYECGHHVMQFLSKVAEVEGDLGPYFNNKSACQFAMTWDVKSFEICFKSAMEPKAKNRFLP